MDDYCKDCGGVTGTDEERAAHILYHIIWCGCDPKTEERKQGDGNDNG